MSGGHRALRAGMPWMACPGRRAEQGERRDRSRERLDTDVQAGLQAKQGLRSAGGGATKVPVLALGAVVRRPPLGLTPHPPVPGCATGLHQSPSANPAETQHGP